MRSPISDQLGERTTIQYHVSWLRTFSLNDRFTRAANLLVAVTVIAFTLPLFIFVCLAIKLDSPGPIFHRQPRFRHDGRRFFVFKFRTTVHDPDGTSRPVWDWRAPGTRVGQFLCYTRIEDLPQLVNVLRGEMTLIGTGAERSFFAD